MASDSLPERWDLETEVLVVGAGNAGLPAAIEAHNAGSKVLLLEGNSFMGGLMRGSGGFMFFCDTHVQRKLGVEDHIEWGIEDEMLMSDFRAVPELVRTYVEGGADTCLWLERLGLVWADPMKVKVGLYGNYIGKRYWEDTNATRLAAVTTADLAATWEPFDKRVGMTLALLNLFDKEYDIAPAFPAGGRQITFSGSFRF